MTSPNTPSSAHTAATAACPHCHTLNRISAGDPAQAHCGRCGAPVFQAQPVELDSAAFARHLQAETPLLVDFWAPWCGPCRMMAPIFVQAAAQLEPRVRLAKVNTDAQTELAQRYAIRSIPTLALFRYGQEVARQAGAMELSRLLAWVRAHA